MKYIFQNGTWTELNTVIPSWKGAETSMKFAEELMSFGLEIITPEPVDAQIAKIFNKATISDIEFVQEYTTAKDQAAADAVVAKYNEAWEKASKEVTGK